MKIIYIFVFFIFFFPSVHAITLTFTDYQLSSQEIDIYYPNGTKLATVTSNGTVTLDDTFDYQLVFRPQKISLLTDPMILLEWGWGFIQILFIILVLIAFATKALKFW